MNEEEFEEYLAEIGCYCEYNNIISELDCLLTKIDEYFENSENKDHFEKIRESLKNKLLEEL